MPDVASWRDKSMVISTLLHYVRCANGQPTEPSCRDAAEKLVQMGFRCVDPETENLKARISRLEGWAGLSNVQ